MFAKLCLLMLTLAFTTFVWADAAYAVVGRVDP